MVISLRLPAGGYDITVERGCLQKAGALFNLNRRVLVVTDSGVPAAYAETVAAQCQTPVVVCIPQGEESKTVAWWEHLCRKMLENGFDRTDCVVAVGGGVVGDLSGFAAAAYMRGIDFYNIPTTVLSQVDSSIGGKVAVDLGSIKNIVGAFHQPKGVLVDPDVLDTLPARQIANGLAEAVKMALTFDADLFALFETVNPLDHIEEIIIRSLQCKKAVVEEDEREGGVRRVLNFGHTVGHAIESTTGLSTFYHGECVALGMLPMCSDAVRARLLPVLKKLNLPTDYAGNAAALMQAAAHDKKYSGNTVTVVTVSTVGSYALEKWTPAQLTARMEAYYG
ncbi:MAG: 3-dehydroquinate synthase [Ruminococcaceae bacterium]|nr:3-dehydroquinate synthase [Oscillospiraceae bacterium]